MQKIKWSIYQDGRHIDSGTILAETEKDALVSIMNDSAGKLELDKSYSFTAGDTATSSYGDELHRSVNMCEHGMDETAPMDGDHHFQPKLSDVGRRTAEIMETDLLGDLVHDAFEQAKGQDRYAPAATDADRRKIARERVEGRRTFTGVETAAIVKSCPAGPTGHHTFEDVPGTIGVNAGGLDYEECNHCGHIRVKRRWRGTSPVNTLKFPPVTPKSEMWKSANRLIQQSRAMDSKVLEVQAGRQWFANMKGVPVENVEVSFIDDEAQFSLKD